MKLNSINENYGQPLKKRFRLKLPQYPPQSVLIFLILLNLILSFVSPNPSLHQILLYIYGSLMLFQAHIIELHLKLTMVINTFIVWSYLNHRVLSIRDEEIIFAVISILYARVIFFSVSEVIKSLAFMKDVTFEHVFWTIQFSVIMEFFHHYTGISQFKLIPGVVRIVQNLRIMTMKSMIGAIRFSLKLILQFLVCFSWQWIALKTFLTIWEVHNDFNNQFVMKRVYQNGNCFYPKTVIVGLFVINFIMLWSWPFTSDRDKVTAKILRRISWNYCRLESRAAENPGKHVLLQIIQFYTNKSLDNISL